MDQLARKQAAFADALDSQLRGIYSYLRRLGVEAASAEDLAQDTLVIAWQNLPSLRDVRHLRGWLYRIAYRRYLRHREAAATTTTGISGELAAAPAQDPGSDEQLEAERVRQALRTLPEPYLHALLLIHWEGFSYQEAARILSLPLGTLAWRVHKATRLLRCALDEKGAAHEIAPEGSEVPRPAGPVGETRI